MGFLAVDGYSPAPFTEHTGKDIMAAQEMVTFHGNRKVVVQGGDRRQSRERWKVNASEGIS
jgi:hypothetical protein